MAKAVNSTSPRTFIVTRRHILRRENSPGYLLLRSALNTLQEDYQDKYDTASHSTSQNRSSLPKLQSSLHARLSRVPHGRAARYACTKQPCPTPSRFSSCNPHLMPMAAMERPHGARSRRSKSCCASSGTYTSPRGRARAMAELSALRERFAAIEVLHEESRAL